MNTYKIVADSGSTKTDWVVLNASSETVSKIRTIGFNPYFHTTEFILSEVSKGFASASFDKDLVSEVHFYGAGCSSEEKNAIVEKALQSQFAKAKVFVSHDLIAAARATLGHEDGIACIIGTGSNSCVWQNGIVTANVPSHGYIFGDEGSGSYLGKELLKLYLEDRMPADLKDDFEGTYGLNKEQLLHKTYREPNPNVFLASFGAFYDKRVQHPVLQDILDQGFDAFYRIRVKSYPSHQQFALGFVGSIAYFYQDILKEVMGRHGMTVSRIVKCPIDELVNYEVKVKV
jgi:N-acetylglucosamine kinase-like BadF-type ATPase